MKPLNVVDPQTFRSFCFRGQGCANFVISAKCRKSRFRIVWRFSKHRKSGTVTVKPKCHAIAAYLEKLIVPIIGREYLVKPKIVSFDVRNLHRLAKIPALPLNMKVESFDELCDERKYASSMSFFPLHEIPEGTRFVSALQMMDATRIPKRLPSRFYGPTITVEIKPKQGFFQNYSGIQLPYCLNCILQLEKMNSNAFDVMYDYCPLDLFSGDIQRMRSALNSLILVPHRNLRIFFNGTVIHSDELSLNHQSLQDTLFHGGSVTIEELVTAICCVLVGAPSNAEFTVQDTSVLAKLLAAQKLDPVGIVKAYEIYQSLSLENQRELLNKCLLPRNDLSFMHENSDQALLQRYFLAATMKDCSVMISLRLIDETITSVPHSRCSPPPIVKIYPSTIQHPDACSVSFAYSIKLVDLDPKTPKNLLNSYQRFVDGVRFIRETHPMRRPCVQ